MKDRIDELRSQGESAVAAAADSAALEDVRVDDASRADGRSRSDGVRVNLQ